MIIIGLNAFHGDSAACIVVDGKLVAAVEEERFRRIKHWAGFPTLAIKYCLEAAGVSLADVDHVAVNSDPRAHFVQKAWYALSRRPSPSLVLDRLRNRKQRSDVATQLSIAFPQDTFTGKVHEIEHHLCHLASSHIVSPFEESVSVSVDGFGDFSSGCWGVGRGNDITVEGRVMFPHSLGIFYQALTQFLGFPRYGDEYKVMGLAPYGKPVYEDALMQVVTLMPDGGFRLNLDCFKHHSEGVSYEWEGGEPKVGALFSDRLGEIVGRAPRTSDSQVDQDDMDLARSVQAVYERAFFHLLNTVYQRHKIPRLTLSGGCAMNSVANGKVYRNTPFESLYIQAAAGDAGGAIGAAFVVAAQTGAGKPQAMDHAYLGPCFSDAQCEEVLKAAADELTAKKCRIEHLDDAAVVDRTSSAIAEGQVIGWFQGRMEWGPRALGNRSILCDPRRADMKDILNRKIKRRESFRPFAPSVLREAVKEWFEEDDDVPFMMQVFQIAESKRNQIPAVVHVDGSGRLQTVHKDTNPRYHALISAFAEKTGVPMVLNTSFNENEPVVCQPQEALDCFLRTSMDVLVMGNWFVSRVDDD